MDRHRIGGALISATGIIATTVAQMMWPQLSASVGYPILAICVILFVGGIWIASGNYFHTDIEKPRKIKQWQKIDATPSFRLGQWAALIDGYHFLLSSDDPGRRPWKETFFMLKRNIENGNFKILNPQVRPDGSVRVGRELLLTRDELRDIYQRHMTERPRALFPEYFG